MDSLDRLVDALRCLKGVGPKSAQRMVYHLLKNNRKKGMHLAACLMDSMQNIKHCERCRNFTEFTMCILCQDSSRDQGIICVVEGPSELLAIEQSRAFTGTYFVLMGKISPLDGLGPEDIGLSRLKDRVIAEGIQELVLALSPSVEGQTTVHFIRELFKTDSITISQLAHGIPSSGELEFLDGSTIGSAFKNRS